MDLNKSMTLIVLRDLQNYRTAFQFEKEDVVPYIDLHIIDIKHV